MLQLIPKCLHHAGFGGGATNQYFGVHDGLGDMNGTVTGRIPVPFAGTFRNLTIYSRATFPSAVVLTLVVNGVASAQTVTLPSGQFTAVTSGGADVSVSALDDISYHYSGPGGLSSPGLFLGTCIEFDGPGNIFGIASTVGTIAIGSGRIGGAFGNGIFALYESANPELYPESNTYSLCAVDGTITTLAIREYNELPDIGAGSWTGYLKVDAVLQDGTGGTVDTATLLTGDTDRAIRTFALPVVLGQRVDVVVVRGGVQSDFATDIFTVGIGFVPTREGEFMLCGGSNDAVTNAAPGWKWTHSDQIVAIEENLAPIGPGGLNALGIYTEPRAAPGNGTSWTYRILQNEGDTPIVVTVSDLELSGLITGLFIEFLEGDTITLRLTPTNTPSAAGPMWGLAARVGVAVGTIGPYVWVHWPRRIP